MSPINKQWSQRIFTRPASLRLILIGLPLLLTCLSGGVSASESEGDVALVGATVVVGNGKSLSDATVLLRNGAIQKVGRNLSVPGDVQVIDAKGLFVYPGLIDALREQAAAGSDAAQAGALYADARVDASKADDAADGEWRMGGVLAANVAPNKGIFRGQSTVRLLGGPAGYGDLDAPVAANVSLQGLGYHNRKVGVPEPGGPFPNRLIGVFGFVRQTVLDARYLQLVRSSGQEVPAELGNAQTLKSLEALGPVTAGKMPVILPAATDRELRRALKLADELDVKPILAGGHGGNEMARDLGARRIPMFFSLHFVDDGEVHPQFRVPLQIQRERWQAPRSAAALKSAGVPLAFYSDGLGRGADFLSGLRRVVRAGLDESAALHAASLGAAELLGVQSRLGSVEAGKIANLIVTDGNLFADATAIRMVFVAGQRYQAAAPGWKFKTAPEPFPMEIPDTFANLLPDLGPVVFVRNVNIMTVSRGTLEGTSMLVRNGKIAAIGAQLTPPKGAHVIDGTGKWITPGMIDLHSHISDSHNDSGANMTSLLSTTDTINPTDMASYRTLSAGVTTAHLMHGSVNPIGGKTVVIKNRWGKKADEWIFEGARPGVKFAVKEFGARQGVAPPSTLMGMEAFLRSALSRAQHYAQEWDLYEKRKGTKGVIPPRRNLRLETLVEVMRGKRDVHVHLYTPEETTLMIRVAEEFGIKIRVFHHATHGYKGAAAIARHNGGGGATIFADITEANLYNAAILSHHGVLTSVNSDHESLARRFNHDVARLRNYGVMSDNEALALVTLNAAKQLGIDARVGSIDTGKDADFVLFDKYPLSAYAIPQMVFIDGKLYFSRDAEQKRQRRVDEILRSLHAARQETNHAR